MFNTLVAMRMNEFLVDVSELEGHCARGGWGDDDDDDDVHCLK